MNLSKNYPLPEFVLLDGDNHLGEQLIERNVILHIPSKTILEVVATDSDELKKFADQPHFPFVFTNIDEEDEHHVILLHETTDEAGLTDLYTKAAQWYGNYANWLDNEINNL